jgi:hypothetical protein
MPAPSPTPTPSPASSPRAALVAPVQTINPASPTASGGESVANPSSSTTFPLLQTAVTINSGFSGDATVTSQGATLSYDKASNHYLLTLNNEDVGVANATATREDYLVNGYHTSGTPISGGRNLQTNVVELTYTNFGYWLIERFPQVGTYEWTNGGTFLGGFVTPPGSIPTTGNATYTGSVTGLYDEAFLGGDVALLVGNVSVTIDFAARSVNGQMTNLQLGSDLIRHSAMNDIAFNAAFNPAQNMFIGTTQVTTVPNGSSAFTADEVGAVWTLSDSVHRLIGSFGARRQ